MGRKIFYLIILCSLGLNSFAQRTLLRFNPEPGSEYVTDLEMHTEISQEIMGIDQNVQMIIIMQMHSKTLDRTADNIPMEFTYQHLEIKMNSPMGEFTLNSADKTEKPENIFMKEMTGKPFTVIFKPDGSVYDIKGIESIIEGMEDVSETNPELRSSIQQNIEQSFGKETFKDNMQNMNVIYPENKIKEGDSWNYSIKTSNRETDLVLNNTVKVLEINKETILLRIDSKIESPDKGFREIDGNEFKINLDGSQIGETIIDRATGMNIENTSNQTINGMMLLKTNSDSEDLLEIPMTIKTKMTLKMSRDE